MRHHFECEATLPRIYDPLVFDWDDETGEISGQDATYVLECFDIKTISAHPMPCAWDLTSPKNRTDIAAIVGECWRLPPELADAYPKLGGDFDGYVRDEAGNIIGQVCF
jgi:hypothetical protein